MKMKFYVLGLVAMVGGAASARDLVTVRNVKAINSSVSNGPGTDHTLKTTLSFEVRSHGCAKASDFQVINHISDAANHTGVVGIYRVKAEDASCPGQPLIAGQPEPVLQTLEVSLTPGQSWAGDSQVLLNPTEIPEQN